MYVVTSLKALASDVLLGDESGSKVIHVQKWASKQAWVQKKTQKTKH